MSRVLAVLVAIGLVVVAVAIRRQLDDEGAGGDGRSGPTRVVCAEELQAACEDLGLGRRFEVIVEDAAVTAARLGAAAPTDVLDVWAVSQPWPAIVDEARSRAGLAPLFAVAPDVLASTALVAVGDASLDGCSWRCLGEKAASGLRIGTRPLGATGVGILTTGAATAGWFGGPAFATNDLDPAFDRWLSALVAATEISSAPVTQLLQSRAFFDVALSFEAEAATALNTASADRTRGLALLRPAPSATLDAVVVTAPGGPTAAARDVADSLADALRAAGWSEPVTTSNGLPTPGVLTALRERVTR